MSPPNRPLHKFHPGPLQVLIPIYPDFNTFDANGPIEVLSQANRNSTDGTQHFQISVTAATELTTSIEGVHMARDIPLTEAIERLNEWDILLVPGGTEKAIMGMIGRWREAKEGNEIMRLVDAYVGWVEGFTFTVCTGSLFLGALGKLEGRTATSHWRSLGTLKKLCEAAGGDATAKSEIVRARWVETGDVDEGVSRIMTAGGVSCGIDATFHLLDLTVGHELAETVAGTLDYQRRGDELQADYVFPEAK